jgi:hypothetical protein
MLSFLFSSSGLVFIGAVLAAIGSLWTSFEQDKTQRDSLILQQEISKKNEEILSLNQKIAKLSLDIKDMVTGGDSFIVANLALIEHDYGIDVKLVTIEHVGRFPLKNVRFEVVDLKTMQRNLVTLNDVGCTQHINNFLYNKLVGLTLPTSNEYQLSLIFYADNGVWNQKVIFVKQSNHWIQSSATFRFIKGQGQIKIHEVI